MKKFEFIEHTADIGLVACGKDLPEAFANAALGMFSIIAELKNVRATEARRVEVAADDVEGLLFEWLNTLLYYFDVENLLFRRFRILEFEDTRLVADCFGETFEAGRHKTKSGVKSATFHRLEVDRRDNRVRVIFDV